MDRHHLRFTPTQVGSRSVRRTTSRYTSGSPPRRWGAVDGRSGSPRAPAVHPHAGGEQDVPAALGDEHLRFTPTQVGSRLRVKNRAAVANGSPPRRWGAEEGPAWQGCPGRFTPTQVGSRPGCAGVFLVALGSPPRRWGAGLAPMFCLCRLRFTPTQVGSRPPSGPAGRSRSVHPHAGGEQLATRGEALMTSGSPPRRWGAGRWPAPSRGGTPVHPHAGGEQDPGQPLGQALERFTPTQVGSRQRPGRVGPSTTVHPHAGGEQATARRARSIRSVHPHAGGEQGLIARAWACCIGSPPRRWGAGR